ncbi:MAG: spore coat associated protein CotJA [Firmicutes bacterium]|nr:spore coat associated protein CotJA [Bacillota bacterium]MBS6798544.1 spore coat associated protein CotJA [Bacillota bacterium]
MYLGSLPIAMCYVPNQRWKTTYSLDKALTVGTVFPELDLPFKGGMKR